jgi:predicted amidohydrolase YtcJ
MKREERDKGSISVGKLGDFAVLSGDPTSIPPKDLFTLKVEQGADIQGAVFDA